MTAGRPSTCLYIVNDCRVNIGTTISTFVIRAGESAKNYRQQAKEMVDTKSKLATEIKDLKSKLTESTRQLAVEKNKYQLHRTSVKTHRTTANAALEQRNVALDKLKAVEQERDRWEDKYASVHCY